MKIKVKATKDGFYGDVRYKAGDEFIVTDEAHVSKSWMARVGKGAGANYDDLTVEQLKHEAQTRGVEVKSEWLKHDLVLALKRSDRSRKE